MGLAHVSASSLGALEPNREDATPDALLARLMDR
jgi:hypothetical protein